MLDHTYTTGCDCDDPQHFPSLLDIESATRLALSLVATTSTTQTVSLSSAAGRICAEDVLATREMPFFDNSAMDGFAARACDFAGQTSLPICGSVAAGDWPAPLAPGHAMRIFTGAPLPKGADAVIKVEDTREADRRVTLIAGLPRPGQNIRLHGSDQARGAHLISKGQHLAAHHIGLLAAQGMHTLDVTRRPRVAIASTGQELGREADTKAAIFDANRPMLLSLAASLGADVIDIGVIPDDAVKTAAALAGVVGSCDLILTSGAVSMGGKDHMRAAVVHAGGQIDGWRVAVKPGKPVMFGRLGGTAITGLPGNPFAAFVGFQLFARPQIAKLAGAPHRPVFTIPAEAGFHWIRKPGRAEIFPAHLIGHTDAGLPRLERLGKSVSATLLPLSAADGLALVPADTAEITPGDRMLWQPFAGAGGLA